MRLGTALIIVDIQNDFLPGGALAVSEGDKTIAITNRMISAFPLVLATQDWHPPNHASFAANHPGRSPGEVVDLDGIQQVLWPIHCVQNTPGAEFAGELQSERIDRVFRKGENPRLDSYSGFFDNDQIASTGLNEFLKEQEVTDVYVLGLATDYCVKFTALDAIRCGLGVHLIADGCRAVNLNPGDEQAAIKDMRNAGVELVSSDQL